MHRHRERKIGLGIATAIAMAITIAPTRGHAATSCIAKSSGVGTIVLSAQNVGSKFKWGTVAGQETRSFTNVATCVTAGTAVGCMVGTVGTLAANTAPASCTFYLHDSNGSCSAWVRKCQPGLRLADASFAAGDPRLVEAFRHPASTSTVEFSGVNVQVDDGSGGTGGATNGLGNLIVGYNENTGAHPHSGSHNLVLGIEQTYSSYGGLLAGRNNTSSGPWAVVSGGYKNTASASTASVSGGTYNVASNLSASVSGGRGNVANAYSAAVSGGKNNIANADAASVSGGWHNTASGQLSSVSGGAYNGASSDYASVSGGVSNNATNGGASVSGGVQNTASGLTASVSGGASNGAYGEDAAIGGGANNSAGGEFATVSGGTHNGTATYKGASVSGGTHNNALANYASVSGGRYNNALSHYASISGGLGLSTSANDEWHAGKTGGYPTGTEY